MQGNVQTSIKNPIIIVCFDAFFIVRVAEAIQTGILDEFKSRQPDVKIIPIDRDDHPKEMVEKTKQKLAKESIFTAIFYNPFSQPAIRRLCRDFISDHPKVLCILIDREEQPEDLHGVKGYSFIRASNPGKLVEAIMVTLKKWIVSETMDRVTKHTEELASTPPD